MIYPENFEEKIGFDSVRNLLLIECRNDISRKFAEDITCSVELAEIEKNANRVFEYKKVLEEIQGYPDPVIPDLIDLLESIKVPGSWFDPELLPDLYQALADMKRYIDFFKGNDELLHLSEIFNEVSINNDLIEAIGDLLDEKGDIADNATPELARIRKEKSLLLSRSESVLKSVLKSAITNGLLSRDTSYTIKNGRFVIPVPASKKRMIKGYVHDESGTGQTLYIEPEEVVELYNTIRELELEERREVIKILIALADKIRPSLEELKNAFEVMGLLDFIRAKAKFAIETNSSLPELVNKPFIDWKKAIHPLLLFAFREQNREVVPMNMYLDDNERVLVISGPNAGGKSVCLKTTGLLQYMLQCGMMIPVAPDSVAGVFKSMFIDIGDEQSLETDLSTYSSHLLNIKMLIEIANRETLFLIDEFGSGTEPNTGGAIAEAVLEIVAASGALGVVTTHFANLKAMSGHVDGIVNGAMLFDTVELQPKYILRIGKPGSSFAFEIASKTGLQKSVLDLAKQKAGKAELDFDIQLQQLDVEKEKILSKEQELKVADQFLAEMIEKYTDLYNSLDASRKEIMNRAKAEAKQILDQSNRLIEKTIKDIREANAEKGRVKKIRASFPEKVDKIINKRPDDSIVKVKSEAVKVFESKEKQEIKNKLGKENSSKSEGKIKVGSKVKMKGHTGIGEVIRIENYRVVVAFGVVQMSVELKQLEKC